MYKKINDYGIIGNLRSAALVGLDGSIDWLCLPHIDSPSVFAALLDNQKGGRFLISPEGVYDSTAFYVKDTNVLTTRFRTSSGVLQVTDFMPLHPGGDGPPSMDLCRVVEVLGGRVRIKVAFQPAFGYGRAPTQVEPIEGGWLARAPSENMSLMCDAPLVGLGDRAEGTMEVEQGHKLVFSIKHGTSRAIKPVQDQVLDSLQRTISFWRGWLSETQTALQQDFRGHEEWIKRSALVLKLLQYEPTGAIAAAATTSLPERIGGVRNWDYRYSWIRDTSMTLKALFQLGHLEETQAYLRWIERLLKKRGPERLRVMYDVRGQEVPPEKELTHLEGYKGSSPVRIGNAASQQRQLDIYGEILDAAMKLSQYVGRVDASMWPALRGICNYVAKVWREADHGIWEGRCTPEHHVHSKVMCWVALDRGITIAKRYGFPAEVSMWSNQRDLIREELFRHGFDREMGSFVQRYGSKDLDASSLRIPLLGFLPFDDPRVVSTVEAVRRALEQDGLLLRYTSQDGLPPGEGAFLLCTFWLVMCLAGLGRMDEAESLLNRAQGTANHLGLFAEQYDPVWRESLGNFPQAFTHIGYINSVLALQQALRQERDTPPSRIGWRRMLSIWPSPKVELNQGGAASDVPQQELAQRLKDTMNLLRGAFFDTSKGRVAYERMARSALYQRYLKLASSLRELDLGSLVDRWERLAFWINLYNALVIHGVIALGIKDSVKEVPNFFNRVVYRIGGHLFSPNDIEHGVLRGNRRAPMKPFPTFTSRDPRGRFSIRPMDPRIHFTLVCASSSCPPIDFYRSDILDHQLTIAAQTFLNAGGLLVDRRRNFISLSRIFKWYGKDFGRTLRERLSAIAPYMEREEDKEYLMDPPRDIKVVYQPYDWRLNRY